MITNFVLSLRPFRFSSASNRRRNVIAHHVSSSSGNSDNDVSSKGQRTSESHESSINFGNSHHSRFQSPIVAKLWESRSEENMQLLKQQPHHKTEDDPIFKNPKDSMTHTTYPFASDEYLREAYKSPAGTMRFGKILEDLDALAANVAFQHVSKSPMLVTAAVDRIALRQVPTPDKDQRLVGQVTWVGTSSMEIRVRLCEVSEDLNGDEENKIEHRTWLEAYFTFVAVDPLTKKPTKIVPLAPETNDERHHFELGALTAAKKKEDRKRGYFLDSGKGFSEEAILMERRARELLHQAFPLLRMPTLADPHSILMEKTEHSNSVIAQPQARNMNNTIFGGYLMRRGFELAFATAYVFGGEWPQMLEVDNVTFYSPVNVGDLLQLRSRVLYSLPEGGNLGSDVAAHKDKPLVMVEVECWITEPAKVQAKLSNSFYFTFMLPTKTTCRKVLPGNLEEARRMVERMVADEDQSKLSRGDACKVYREAP